MVELKVAFSAATMFVYDIRKQPSDYSTMYQKEMTDDIISMSFQNLSIYSALDMN